VWPQATLPSSPSQSVLGDSGRSSSGGWRVCSGGGTGEGVTSRSSICIDPSSNTTSQRRTTFSLSGSQILKMLDPSYPTSMPSSLRSSNLALFWRLSFGMCA